ncbi:MAG: RHS repeat-associated core domain-containing protein [Chitinophagaceae bacterium]|nr:RHS repeat-associated core domain-containing protein [Chitinophagaceae bacterium]MCW5927861.1 RHS repeat-associated core domain-containing protein [Chitinophagaceae bacterium]
MPADPDNPNYTDRLLFIGHEEGRIRFDHNNNTLHYDYFIKDHLGNIRMVLTEEQKQDIYPAATLEGSPNAAFVEKDYYTIDPSKVAPKTDATGITDYPNHNGNPPVNPNPNSNVTANSAKLYKLNGSTNKTGLGITLKVMVGDRIDILGKSYYFQNNTGGTGANLAIPPLEIVTGLLGGPTGGVAAASHGGVTASQLNGNSNTTTGINTLLTNQTTNAAGAPTVPKAYINYIFFDEQFSVVASGFSKVGSNSVVKTHTDLTNKTAAKNGYVYIYVSNESPVNVFFDNLQVIHTRGQILEETHYYPFGLTMAGISSKALNNAPTNRYKYNGKELQSHEFSDGTGLELYDYGARMQDPQIGRWWVQDKFAEVYVSLNPYQYAANNPIKIVDEAGHLLKDKDGNILATSNGNKIHEKTIATSSSSSIVYRYKNITVYTDAGNPVSAQMVVGFVRKSVSNGKVISTPISSASINGNLVSSNSIKSNCFGYTFANGQAIIMDGIDNIINDEYNFIEKRTGNDVNESLENDADIVVIYGGDFDGENFEDGFAYHVGKKDKNKNWSDKDSYTGVRRGLKSSKDVENSPLSISGNKERLFFRKKDGSKDNPNAVIRITDPEEIKKFIEQLKREQ